MVTLILDRKIGSSQAELYSAIPMRVLSNGIGFDLNCCSVAALLCIRNIDDFLKMSGPKLCANDEIEAIYKQVKASMSKFVPEDFNAFIHSLVETCADASMYTHGYLRLRLSPLLNIDVVEERALDSLVAHFMSSLLFFGKTETEVRVFCTRLLGVLIQTRTFTF